MQRHNRYRNRRKKRATLPEISLTPLIDTTLTLLIIFMVTTPMINNIIKVELPSSRVNEDRGTQQDLVVFIDNKERLFFNDRSVTSLNDLISVIKKNVGNNTQRTVFVKADKHISYGRVIELVDHIKVIGGISYVALATKRT